MNERIKELYKQSVMKVYIVIRNDKIDSVFQTQEKAQAHIDSIKGWNLWKIVEKDIEGTLV